VGATEAVDSPSVLPEGYTGDSMSRKRNDPQARAQACGDDQHAGNWRAQTAPRSASGSRVCIVLRSDQTLPDVLAGDSAEVLRSAIRSRGQGSIGVCDSPEAVNARRADVRGDHVSAN